MKTIKTSSAHTRSVRVRKCALLMLAAAGVACAVYFINDRSNPLPAYTPSTGRDTTTNTHDDTSVLSSHENKPGVSHVAAHNKAVEHMADAEPVMELPRFFGVDDKQRPYHITAEKASWEDKDHAVLDAVRADAAFENGTVDIKADRGRYGVTDRVLTLEGAVTIKATRPDSKRDDTRPQRLHVRTERLTAELKNSRVYSDTRVRIRSESGTLEADTFGYEADSGIALFAGNVVLTFNTDALRHASDAITP